MIRLPDDFVPPVPDRWIEVRSAGGVRLSAQVHGPLQGRLHGRVHGPGHARPDGPDAPPTVLLSHGWTLAARYWSRVIRRLRTELRVVAYDQRGHGSSSAVPPGGFCTDALADDLAAVLGATVPAGGRTVLVGHSMGAMSVLAFAERHPELLARRVSGAVLVDTGVEQLLARARIVPTRRAARTVAEERLVAVAEESRVRRLEVAVSRRILTRPELLRNVPAPVLRSIVAHTTLSPAATATERAWTAEVIAACSPETAAGFAEMLGDLDLAAAVPHLVVPTLVVVGDADRLTPPWHARRLAEALPQCVGLVEVPGVGHMTPVQAPDAVADAVRRIVALA